MQTLEVSDAVYNVIISRRIGNEAVSKTIAREFSASEAYRQLQELDDKARKAEKSQKYSLAEVRKEFGL